MNSTTEQPQGRSELVATHRAGRAESKWLAFVAALLLSAITLWSMFVWQPRDEFGFPTGLAANLERLGAWALLAMSLCWLFVNRSRSGLVQLASVLGSITAATAIVVVLEMLCWIVQLVVVR